MISAIVMASGFSSRMGQNKLLMSYNNKTIIQKVLDVVKECDFKEVIVVSQYKEVLEIAKSYNFKSLINENAHLGQSESIKVGILNSSKSEGYMFFVGDQPLIKESDVNNLIKAFKEDMEYIIIPTCEGKRGNPVIFPKALKEEFLKLRGDEKGKCIIKYYKKIKYIDVNKETLMDIDTMKDYKNIIKTYCI